MSAPDHAGLRLAALAQEDHVVAGEQRVLELREDGVLVALHDHREEHLARLDAGDGVASQLLLHRHRGPPRLAELADRGGRGVRGSRGHGANLSPGPRVAVQAVGSGTVSAVRLRWFLTMTTILAATVGVTVLISEGLDRGPGAATRWWPAPTRSTSTTADDDRDRR